MASRLPSEDNLDYFPTPPWATRALFEHVLPPIWAIDAELHTAWEPACGAGDMARPMMEYLPQTDASDVVDRGFGRVADFLWHDTRSIFPCVSLVATNPPFVLAEQFVLKALEHAHSFVAIFARASFIESVSRYNTIFHESTGFAVYAPFSERVPLFRGRLDKKGSSATAYAWFVWIRGNYVAVPRLKIIPPCRKQLERAGDYTRDTQP